MSTTTEIVRTNNGNGHQPRMTVMGSLSERYSMDPAKLLETIRATCIKGNATPEQTQAFLIVANRYGLDPFLKEIHAFAGQGGAIVPIVGIDGWSRIANNSGKFDGCDFTFDGTGDDLECTCRIHVKGRAFPIAVTEYYRECRKNTAPWSQWPKRMLRHKSFMQACRVAFSLSGIYDEDEAREIIRNESPTQAPAPRGVAALAAKITARPVSEGQTFEPTHEAVVEAEYTEPQAETPDVSGAEAEPPAEAVALPDVSDWTKFETATIECAMDANVPEQTARAALAKLKLGDCASAKSNVGKPARVAVIAAMMNPGAFDWLGAKVL